MPKEYINPDSLFSSLEHGFSQIVAATGRKTIYISGQTAWNVQKQIIGGTNLGEQAKQAFRNVQTAVEAAGGTLEDVVSLRIYIVNYKPEEADVVGDALREFFPKERRPANTWIGVSSLAVADFLIEIEAIAVLD
jgi:enamine deaminase RidA (YjgF/YER057c/UK114 family)